MLQMVTDTVLKYPSKDPTALFGAVAAMHIIGYADHYPSLIAQRKQICCCLAGYFPCNCSQKNKQTKGVNHI